MHFFDKFANGTVRQYFFNGTIATYHNGVFIRYDMKPQSFFGGDQNFINFPT
jgi:hypothetical protein